eukprot:SAG31_NODE_34007_length_337_cov_1.525210_1_plen_58_part_01
MLKYTKTSTVWRSVQRHSMSDIIIICNCFNHCLVTFANFRIEIQSAALDATLNFVSET